MEVSPSELVHKVVNSQLFEATMQVGALLISALYDKRLQEVAVTPIGGVIVIFEVENNLCVGVNITLYYALVYYTS